MRNYPFKEEVAIEEYGHFSQDAYMCPKRVYGFLCRGSLGLMDTEKYVKEIKASWPQAFCPHFKIATFQENYKLKEREEIGMGEWSGLVCYTKEAFEYYFTKFGCNYP